MDRHNCDMRRRYETHPIVLRSQGIRRFKLKYVDLQKRKAQFFLTLDVFLNSNHTFRFSCLDEAKHEKSSLLLSGQQGDTLEIKR